MSRLIRAMRLSPEDRLFTGSREDIINLIASVTGQQSNLPEPFGAEPIGDPAMDFLKGPSMASILLKNAKGMTLRNQMEEAQMAGMDPEAVARRRAQNDIEMSMGPMIASIKQLDR